jgi:hypothetical protein
MCARRIPNTQLPSPTKPTETGGSEAARKAVELLGHIRQRLMMAHGWFKTIRRIHVYHMRIKKDFERNVRAMNAADSSRNADSGDVQHSMSLREGGEGGGLEEFKLLQKTLQEFGSIDDEDITMPDADVSSEHEDTNESGNATLKADSIGRITPESNLLRHERWNPVNSSGPLPPVTNGHGTTSNPNSAHSRSGSGSLAAFSPVSQQGHQSGRPQHPSTQFPVTSPAHTTTISLPHQMQSPVNADTWLSNLDTQFGADDFAAFVAGNSWEEFSESDGWLSTIWSGNPATMNI